MVWFQKLYQSQKYASIYQNMFKIVDDKCMDDNMKELADQVDVIFTATPQGLCSTLVNEESFCNASSPLLPLKRCSSLSAEKRW